MCLWCGIMTSFNSASIHQDQQFGCSSEHQTCCCHLLNKLSEDEKQFADKLQDPLQPTPINSPYLTDEYSQVASFMWWIRSHV